MQGFLTLLVLLLALASPLRAQPTPVSVGWELAALPGKGLLAVLWLTPAEGYKTYGHDPGQTGLPTTVQARLTPRGDALAVLYPPGKSVPDLFEKDKLVNVYDHPTPLFLPLPDNAPPGFGLSAKVSLLACSDTSCWPLSIETDFSSRETPDPPQADTRPWWKDFAALAREAASRPTATPAAKAAAESAAQAVSHAGDSDVPDWKFTPRSVSPGLEVDSLLKALPLALLAGFILNLMPCVLPVVCLKLSGLLAVCHSDKRCDRHLIIRRHNLFFALGVMAYFSVLAVVLGMAGMAWGQLFQRPSLILGASVVLFALGLSLFEVFHLPVIDLKIASRPGRDPRIQAFATGLLATLLATPCSGPFLGGVLAWTLMQPVAVIVAVFAGIGLGMAGPYLALAARPQLVRFVPRPGPWMTQIEKLAGFVIMATCLYFLSILPQGMLVPALIAMLVTAFGCHAWGTWTNLSQSRFTRWSIRLAAVALSVAACVWGLTPPATIRQLWLPFDKAAFNQSLGQENLLLDFTADWCPTCKALEKTVLTNSALTSLEKRYGFKAVRVDLTRESPEAMALLRALGSASIPVTAIFPKGEGARSPVVLRDLYTSAELELALKAAFGETGTVKKSD